jgi:hypothetical protein
MSDDYSPGDARKPYSDISGPAAKHAQTHDVRREQLTNPKGSEPVGTSFAEQMEPGTPWEPGIHADESSPAVDDKNLHDRLPQLTNDELARLPVLDTDTQLEQGSVYLDLNQLDKGPFRALARSASRNERLIAKQQTDYLLWNRLAIEDADPTVERPEGAGM